MHGYRLTKRGKIVLASLNLLICLSVIVSLRGIAVANEDLAMANDDINELSSSIYLDKPVSEAYELDNERITTVYNNEIMELDDIIIVKNEDNILNKNDDNALDENENNEFLSIDVEDIRSYEKGKLAFLTFDDGPSEIVTPEILTVLDNYGIKATFFVLGSMCEKNGSILVDLVEKGHSLGIHSYSHELDLLLESEESFTNELLMTENTIKKHLGEDFTSRLFRFPGGSFESHKRQYMSVLNEHGYIAVDWNALTGDTEYLNPTPEILMGRLKETIINKDRIIVLMHDSDTKQVTADVLPDVIEYLISEGYEFALLK
ncbi:MAG: polysaccharide deacetylase family protein [Tissierellia bacterium]|jgi:peptidoglycan/xylan/chitin deacetylase (PgdA/CDA1 family)|nr:polysaccharide deacetylase family protein [Tissierellia bacterium]